MEVKGQMGQVTMKYTKLAKMKFRILLNLNVAYTTICLGGGLRSPSGHSSEVLNCCSEQNIVLFVRIRASHR